MRLGVGEFMRRFLLHVLPDGFHRIRHYGLLANGHRADKLACCRKLLDVPPVATDCDEGNHDGNVDNEMPPPVLAPRVRRVRPKPWWPHA
jgi:Putative transposase